MEKGKLPSFVPKRIRRKVRGKKHTRILLPFHLSYRCPCQLCNVEASFSLCARKINGGIFVFFFANLFFKNHLVRPRGCAIGFRKNKTKEWIRTFCMLEAFRRASANWGRVPSLWWLIRHEQHDFRKKRKKPLQAAYCQVSTIKIWDRRQWTLHSGIINLSFLYLDFLLLCSL